MLLNKRIMSKILFEDSVMLTFKSTSVKSSQQTSREPRTMHENMTN